MSVSTARLILCGLCLWALACAATALSLAGATDDPKGNPTAGPATVKSPAVPEAEKSRANPVPNVPEAIESGRSLFASQCAMCHGAKADGRGDVAGNLKLRVPDLTDPEHQKKRTDGEWFYIISHGHGDMPAEKRLPDQAKWEMIRYLRTIARTPPAR